MLYERYEDGKIERHFDGKQLIRFDEEGYIYRKEERK